MTIQIQELCSRLRQLYLPAVCDALYQLGLEEKVLPSYLRPLFPDDRMVGVAFTVEGRGIDPPVPWAQGIERMTSYLEVFERLPIDSVLVSVNHSSHVGHFGELTANAAQQRGCRGIVLDGNLRDIEGLRQIGFPVFYRDLSPLNGIGRWEMISSQQPVEIGGVTIEPGDIVFGEFDGVLVIPGADAVRVLEVAEGIASSEAQVRADMQAGTSPRLGLERHGHI
jgi:4-hydroxy-4-methyl-2-oxoglutarate aldolase